MDENYLDNLLNEFSLDKEIDHKIEDELDNQMMEEKHKKQETNAVSREDAFDMDLSLDADLMTENDDLHFSEEQMDELDHLDNLADLDMGDLDFSDIDFEDLDVTKLDDVTSEDFEKMLKDFEGDYGINGFFDEESKEKDINVATYDEDVSEPLPLNETVFEDTDAVLSEETLDTDTFDTDSFLDTLLDETESNIKNEPITSLPEEDNASAKPNDDELEDLFSMLDSVENTENDENAFDSKEKKSDFAAMEELEGLDDLGDIEELDDNNNVVSQKKKTFMEVLFGEPDEDDVLSEEELAALEAKKEAKKAKKAAAKEAKKAAKEEKSFKDEKKKKAKTEQKRVRAEKIKKEQAEAEPEKKLNIPAVIFIFTIFLGGTFLFFVASNDFNYKLAIEKASTYFANQKYRSAYDEIVGVEVKEKDQDLKDRIYTVMYVERLYESYENNMEINRPEKALDALLRGVNKYYEHYEEAKELGVIEDLDYSFRQISDTLSEKYGITVDKAIEINAMENDEYVSTINKYIDAK